MRHTYTKTKRTHNNKMIWLKGKIVGFLKQKQTNRNDACSIKKKDIWVLFTHHIAHV